METKGITLDKIVKSIYTIKPKQMAMVAKPVVKEQLSTVSQKISALVKDKAMDDVTHSVYVDEKDLQYPSKVKGNLKPKPISSNLLLTFLDKGTKPHPIRPIENSMTNFRVKMLHFMYNGSEVFTTKTVNHPGTKASNAWDKAVKLAKDAVSKFTTRNFKSAMQGQQVKV